MKKKLANIKRTKLNEKSSVISYTQRRPGLGCKTLIDLVTAVGGNE